MCVSVGVGVCVRVCARDIDLSEQISHNIIFMIKFIAMSRYDRPTLCRPYSSPINKQTNSIYCVLQSTNSLHLAQRRTHGVVLQCNKRMATSEGRYTACMRTTNADSCLHSNISLQSMNYVVKIIVERRRKLPLLVVLRKFGK